MKELLENLKRFIDAGDESRSYLLSRWDARLIVDALEKVPAPVKVFSFAELRDEARAARDKRMHDREDRYFPKDSA